MVSRSFSHRNVLRFIRKHTPLVQNLAEKYSTSKQVDTVPCAQLEALLCKLPNLTELDLSCIFSLDCQFAKAWTNLTFLQNLTHLEFIALSGFLGDYESLMNNALTHIPSLIKIDLTCVWKNVVISPKLNNLQILWLGNSVLDQAAIKAISELPSLTELDLSFSVLSQKDMEILGKSKSLKRLYLTCARIAPAGLPYLTMLEHLDMTRVQRYGGISHLLKLTSLKTLVIPRATTAEISTLEKSLPNLKITLDTSS